MKIDTQNREGPVRATVRSPHGTRKVPYGPFTGFLRPNGQIKTPGELGAANSAPRRPYGLKNCPGARRNFTAAGRTPAGNSQNVCFYSPYGPRSVYVKRPISKTFLGSKKRKKTEFNKGLQIYCKHIFGRQFIFLIYQKLRYISYALDLCPRRYSICIFPRNF